MPERYMCMQYEHYAEQLHDVSEHAIIWKLGGQV